MFDLKLRWEEAIGKGMGQTAKRALKHVLENCGYARGKPDLAMAAMDKYIVSGGGFLMNIGPEKGEIIDNEMARANPKAVVELGTYCGYSAVRMARFLKAGERPVWCNLVTLHKQIFLEYGELV